MKMSKGYDHTSNLSTRPYTVQFVSFLSHPCSYSQPFRGSGASVLPLSSLLLALGYIQAAVHFSELSLLALLLPSLPLASRSLPLCSLSCCLCYDQADTASFPSTSPSSIFLEALCWASATKQYSSTMRFSLCVPIMFHSVRQTNGHWDTPSNFR